MEVATVNCSSCGAPIRIPPELEYFNCAFCGASLVVQRGEGYIALKLVEQVSKSIQDVGEQTQSTIREGTQVTQVELKRLQLSQEISSLQIQLSSIQSEIRSLQRQKADRKIKRQLKELSGEEASLIDRIKGLQTVLAQSYPAQDSAQSESVEEPQEPPAGPKSKTPPRGNFCTSPIGKGCLTGLLVLIAGSIVCGIPAQALDQAIFNIPMGANSSSNQPSGPIFSLAGIFITVAFVVGFAYGVNPKAKIWISTGNWIRGRLGKARKQTTFQTDSVNEGMDGVVAETSEKLDQL